jgi:hypothetical protein
MVKLKKIDDKIVIGLTEKIVLKLKGNKKEEIMAKIDTGASKSSIDLKLAAKLKLGPVIKSKMIKSAHGNRLRPIIIADIEIARKRVKSEFTLADRSHMTYPILIGVNTLKHGFLIDPSKNSYEEKT